MKRDYKDCYEDSIKRVTHERPKLRLWQWLQDSIEPETFVNWCIVMYFGLTLFYILLNV